MKHLMERFFFRSAREKENLQAMNATFPLLNPIALLYIYERNHLPSSSPPLSPAPSSSTSVSFKPSSSFHVLKETRETQNSIFSFPRANPILCHTSQKKSENPQRERERSILNRHNALRNMFRRTMATSARTVKYNAHGAPASVLR